VTSSTCGRGRESRAGAPGDPVSNRRSADRPAQQTLSRRTSPVRPRCRAGQAGRQNLRRNVARLPDLLPGSPSGRPSNEEPKVRARGPLGRRDRGRCSRSQSALSAQRSIRYRVQRPGAARSAATRGSTAFPNSRDRATRLTGPATSLRHEGTIDPLPDGSESVPPQGPGSRIAPIDAWTIDDVDAFNIPEAVGHSV
jgi:hypothetical protein